jgi:hypothetical protein
MKTNKILFVLVVVILALPFAGRLFWLMKGSKTLNILIVNKSVEKTSFNEVKALNWTLNFEKYENSGGELYDFKNDYLGYYPEAPDEERRIKSFKLEDIKSLAEKNDALFFIDNSGVKINKTGKKISKITFYGGFNQNDYSLLKEMVGLQKLVVAEYNFFSPPTEDLVRYNTEQFLDIYSLGWIGKLFEDISKDKLSGFVPAEWFDLYKQNYKSDWEFTGPGLILINQSQNRIVILPSDKYMNSGYPDIITDMQNASHYNIPEKTAYSGWFEISYQGKNKVISHFNLNLNQDGVAILKKNGIEPEFPAVIESVNNKFFYIAGDFSKVNSNLLTSRFSFLSSILLKMNSSKTDNPDRFFQTYYNSLLTTILKDYTSEISVPQK